jgi:poly-gamma-glutamate synthesis protein (capsule biosynthesis protein)
MSYTGDHYQPSVVQLARSGNFRAIAYWLNVFLLPHNLYARVEAALQPGCLQVLVEFHPSPDHDAKSPEFRASLVRFICHHLWKLNSEVIEGVQVMARYVGQPHPLWQQSVRVMSPARRARSGRPKPVQTPSLSHPIPLRSRVQQATRQKVQFRALRSLLLTGTTAAAFIIGCWLGYSDAPTDQTNASASPMASTRPDTILTAMGNVSVQKQTVPNPTDPTTTLMFGGDVTLTDAYTDLVGSDSKWAFAALEEYRQADVAMLNLEAPFTIATTAAPDKDFNFKANPETVQVLKNGGVDIVNLANNHVMDYQTAGLDETLKTLDQAGIHSVGAGRDAQEARRPEIMDVKGQRIAYLGYYDGDFQTASDSTPGSNAGQHDRIAADIKAIRDQVDWVVVNYHWGVELAKYPTDAQIDLAHFTIDQGADLVVGHHPHILQGAEIYKGRPIIYSLGNFIFGGNSRSDYDTAVLKVGLKDHQMKVEFLPVEVKSYQPKVVSGDRGTEILHQIENVSDIFQQPMKSPMILDARSRTVISTPTQSDAPTSNQAPETFAPSPSQTPSSETAPTIESVPSPSQAPNSDPAESTPSTQIPSSETTPSPSASDSEPPAGTPITQPTESPTGTQPWKNDSFISAPSPSSTIAPDAGMSPSPVPESPVLESPVPESPDPMATPSPEATPEQQGAANSPNQIGVVAPSISPTASPKPINSLEPMKKRYAQAPSPKEVAAAISSEE